MGKKVRYAMGIAGLAPAAVLATAGTATAAPAAPGKTVSGHVHGQIHPDTCTGVKNPRVSFTSSSMSYWYTSYEASTCIGFVTGFRIGSESRYRVRIYHGTTREAQRSVKAVSSGGSVAFHSRFAHPVKMCQAWRTSGTIWHDGGCITRG